MKCTNLISVKVDWSINFSDHAAVITSLAKKEDKMTPKSRLTRLDPAIMRNSDHKILIEAKLTEMMELANPEWDPHMKLEYAKMSIRTATEKVQADVKARMQVEEDEINEELNTAIDKAARVTDVRQELLDYIESLRRRKEVLVEEKGKRLAEKLGTKWYNEGEKSTKYFLRLLNRRGPDVLNKIVKDDGTEILDGKEIEKEVTTFYKKLYESYDKSHEENNVDEAFFQGLEAVTEDDDVGISSPITE